MTVYNWIIIALWVAFVVYWAISARSAKKVAHRDLAGVWVRYVGFVIVILLIIFLPASFNIAFGAHTPTVMAIGTILCGAGIAFAIWARWHLGKNWNSGPSIQEGHELVTSGPYRFVRHPIYTGLIVALLGSALATNVGWFIIFLFLGSTFVWRIDREEKFMMQLFPNEYPEYKKRTRKLIPLIW